MPPQRLARLAHTRPGTAQFEPNLHWSAMMPDAQCSLATMSPRSAGGIPPVLRGWRCRDSSNTPVIGCDAGHRAVRRWQLGCHQGGAAAGVARAGGARPRDASAQHGGPGSLPGPARQQVPRCLYLVALEANCMGTAGRPSKEALILWVLWHVCPAVLPPSVAAEAPIPARRMAP